MSGWRALVRVLAERVRRRPAQQLAAAHSACREELRALRRSLSEATRQMAALELQLEQLAAVRDDDVAAGPRLDGLAAVVDTARVAEHVRGAVRDATRVDEPVVHAIVPDLLPSDLYRALADTIPADLFFRTAVDGTRELVLPPKLAPLDSVAAWTFLTQMVEEVVVPALQEQFAVLLGPAAPARLIASRPRLVRGGPGGTQWQDHGHLLTTVVTFVRGDDVRNEGNAAVTFVPGAAPTSLWPEDAAGADGKRYAVVLRLEARR